MRNHVMCFSMLFFLAACQLDTPRKNNAEKMTHPVKRDTPSVDSANKKIEPKISALELKLQAAGLIDVQTLDSTLAVDLKYSTRDNFMKLDMYGDLTHAYLQKDVAEKLVKAQQALRAIHASYRLVVYDAVRPLHIQQLMWDTVRLPRAEKTKYLSNPARGSIHNYGAAVDVSILDSLGSPLDMGTPYDFFGEEAHPVKENELLAKGELTKVQIQNRQILRAAMRAGGFWGIQTEWWHFNSCTRVFAAENYLLVK
jgi:zinc D-Ala-D-Ala dipeptidase